MGLGQYLSREEPHRLLKKRKSDLVRTLAKEVAWTRYQALMRLGWCLAALDRDDEALLVTEPVLDAQGVDDGGNCVDGFAFEAAGFQAWLLERAGKDSKKLRAKAAKGKGDWSYPPKDIDAQLDYIEREQIEWALWRASSVLSELAVRRIVSQQSQVEEAFTRVMSMLEKRLGKKSAKPKKTKKPPAKKKAAGSGGIRLDAGSLLKWAGREENAVLAELLTYTGHHVQNWGAGYHAVYKTLLSIAWSLYALERNDESAEVADLVIRQRKPSSSGSNEEITSAQLVKLYGIRQTGGSEKQIAAEIKKHDSLTGMPPGFFNDRAKWVLREPLQQEPQRRRGIASHTGLISQAAYLLQQKRAPKQSKKLEKARDNHLEALRKKLSADQDTLAARAWIERGWVPASAKVTEMPTVFKKAAQDKNQKLAGLTKTLKKFSLRSEHALDKLLAIATALLALGRSDEAMEAFQAFTELDFMQNYDLWAVISRGIGLRAYILYKRGGKADLQEIDWLRDRVQAEPWNSYGDGELKDRCDEMKDDLAKLAKEARQKIVHLQYPYKIGFAAELWLSGRIDRLVDSNKLLGLVEMGLQAYRNHLE